MNRRERAILGRCRDMLSRVPKAAISSASATPRALALWEMDSRRLVNDVRACLDDVLFGDLEDAEMTLDELEDWAVAREARDWQ